MSAESPRPSHKWDDVSYHGSALYQCDYCGCFRSDLKAELPCLKAEERLAQRRREEEAAELAEYRAMEKQFARWAYLEGKYGKG